jgi:hypothetical protein
MLASSLNYRTKIGRCNISVDNFYFGGSQKYIGGFFFFEKSIYFGLFFSSTQLMLFYYIGKPISY